MRYGETTGAGGPSGWPPRGHKALYRLLVGSRGRRKARILALAVAAALVLSFAVLRPLHRAGTSDQGNTNRGTANAEPAGSHHWVGSWQTADQRGRPVHLSDRTVRMTMRTSLGGNALRVRLSNTFGERPLQIGAATIGWQGHDADVLPDTTRPLLFHGKRSVTIPAGGRLRSDPVALTVPDRTVLSVSIYLPHYKGMPTSHGSWGSSHRTSYVSMPGNHTNEVSGDSFITPTRAWYFVDGIDVAATDPRAGAVVAFGDSLTDGSGSTNDADQRYPDQVAARLADSRGSMHTAMLNAGIAGNRILTDAPRSVSGLSRFHRDALEAPGVRTVLLLEGTNDIGNAGATPRQVIAGLRKLTERAHEQGLRVVGATITPGGGCLCGHGTLRANRVRQVVNRWIRSTNTFDGVADFDAATRDQRHPRRLNPLYDRGDHLHLNDRGYRALAEAVDLRQLVSPHAQSRASGTHKRNKSAHHQGTRPSKRPSHGASPAGRAQAEHAGPDH